MRNSFHMSLKRIIILFFASVPVSIYEADLVHDKMYMWIICVRMYGVNNLKL